MRKFIQISLIVLVVMAIAVSALALTGTGSAMAGKAICPMVGWNNGAAFCGLASSPSQSVQGVAFSPRPPRPLVGWNS
jgi:hypothetical protein